MKLSNPSNPSKLSKSRVLPGLTLIELTVVLVVLLTLITVLYFSATAYIKASNRSACLANQARLQKAMRGFQTLNQLHEASTFNWSSLDSGGFTMNSSNQKCPTNSVEYLSGDDGVVPPAGVRVAPCVDPDFSAEHVADSLSSY